MNKPPSPRQTADAMFARDRASQSLKMQIEEVGNAGARLSMTVSETMLNGHDICHGGMIFALADSAFAFASNSENRVVVAAGCDIEYVRPARLGERLTAECRLSFSRGRTNFFDVRVANGGGETVALFRGRGRVLEEKAAPAAARGK